MYGERRADENEKTRRYSASFVVFFAKHIHDEMLFVTQADKTHRFKQSSPQATDFESVEH